MESLVLRSKFKPTSTELTELQQQFNYQGNPAFSNIFARGLEPLFDLFNVRSRYMPKKKIHEAIKQLVAKSNSHRDILSRALL